MSNLVSIGNNKIVLFTNSFMVCQYDNHILSPLDHQAVYHCFLQYGSAYLSLRCNTTDPDKTLISPNLPYC